MTTAAHTLGPPPRREGIVSSSPANPSIQSDYVGADALQDRPPTLSLIMATTKPGITRMVTMSAAVGFVVSALYHGRTLPNLIEPAVACLFGTALAASGANALNQYIERHRDALMERTSDRPLPAGHLSPGTVLIISLLFSVLGPLVLAMTSHFVAAAITLITIVVYAAVYTPLKPVTPKSTVIGAVPGALPMLIGWTAASPTSMQDLLHWPAWTLFLLLFAWQMPHFLAIAVMYRDQYANAGYRTLLQTASDDRDIIAAILAWTVVQLAASAGPLLAMPKLFGLGYGLTALAMGIWMLVLARRLRLGLTRLAARRLFFASIIYLPVLFLALILDAFIGSGSPV